MTNWYRVGLSYISTIFLLSLGLFDIAYSQTDQLPLSKSDLLAALDSISETGGIADSAQFEKVDLLRKTAKELDYTYGEGYALLCKGLLFDRNYVLDSSIYYAKKSLPYLEEDMEGDESWLANYLAARTSLRQDKLDSAWKYIQVCTSLTLAKGGDKKAADLALQKGAYYYQKVELGRSVEQFRLAGQKYKLLQDTMNWASSLINTGAVLTRIRDWKGSMKEYQQAKELFKAMGNSDRSATLMSNIGLIYSETDKPEQAIEAFRTSLAEKVRRKDVRGQVYTKIFMARHFDDYNQVDSALVYFEKALAQAKEIQSEARFAYVYGPYSKTLQKAGRIEEAKKYGLKGYKWAKEHQEMDYFYSISASLAMIYEKEGNYKSAYTYFSPVITVLDSLLENQMQTEFYKKEITYLEAQQALKDQVASQELSLKEKSLSSQRLQLILLALALMLALSVAFALVFFYRKSQKHNQELSEANSLIQVQADKLQSQKHELEYMVNELNLNSLRQKETIQYLENFAAVAAHDLKAPLRLNNNFLQVLERKTVGKLEKNEKEIFSLISSNNTQLGSMIDDLLELSKLEYNLPPVKEIQLSSVISKVKANLFMMIQESGAEISYPADCTKVWGHETLLMQLFQNLLTNSMIYRKEGQAPHISIHFSSSTSQVHFIEVLVKDNGRGIEKECIPQLFDLFSGDSQSTGSGIGLATCKKIVEKYGGKIWITSELGIGTQVHFTLPHLSM